MALKICSNKDSPGPVGLALLVAALIFFSACARISPAPEPAEEKVLPPPALVPEPDRPAQVPDSRMAASRSLTLEGHRLLEKKDYNGAIRALERAVGVNPADGPACFYLAEAWMGKKNFALAAQFNGLAALYLRGDPAWSRRAELQKERINRKIKGK